MTGTNPANAKALTPAIQIIKKINGYDANVAPVSAVPGTTMRVTFEVSNTGDVALANVVVSDDVIAQAAITCPATTLAIGASMTCTAGLSAPAAGVNHVNTGTATGRPVDPTLGLLGTAVTDTDIATAVGATPGIFVVKMINADDANSAPGVSVAPGARMDITFDVTNTAGVVLTNVQITDDKVAGTAISCPKTVLAIGESMTCVAVLTAPAAAVQHTNTVTALGVPIDPVTGPGTPVSATDVANALPVTPVITVVKRINGDDANTAPGVVTAPGATMQITFEVTNTGPLALQQVTVTDDAVASNAITCPTTSLAVGASMTCTAALPSPEAGVQHTNIGTALERAGDLAGTAASWEKALAIYESLASPSADSIRRWLDRVRKTLGVEKPLMNADER